jgi:hypothetical protein
VALGSHSTVHNTKVIRCGVGRTVDDGAERSSSTGVVERSSWASRKGSCAAGGGWHRQDLGHGKCEGNGAAIGNSGGRKISHLGGVLLQGIRPVVRVAAQ